MRSLSFQVATSVFLLGAFVALSLTVLRPEPEPELVVGAWQPGGPRWWHPAEPWDSLYVPTWLCITKMPNSPETVCN